MKNQKRFLLAAVLFLFCQNNPVFCNDTDSDDSEKSSFETAYDGMGISIGTFLSQQSSGASLKVRSAALVGEKKTKKAAGFLSASYINNKNIPKDTRANYEDAYSAAFTGGLELLICDDECETAFYFNPFAVHFIIPDKSISNEGRIGAYLAFGYKGRLFSYTGYHVGTALIQGVKKETKLNEKADYYNGVQLEFGMDLN